MTDQSPDTTTNAGAPAGSACELGMSVPPIIAQGKGAEHDDLHRAR
jgi:hypothetical protein